METDKALKELEKLIAEAEHKLDDAHKKFEESSQLSCAGSNPQQTVRQHILFAIQAQLYEMKALETEGIPNNKALHLALLEEYLENQIKGLKETLTTLRNRKKELLGKKEWVKHVALEEQHLAMLCSQNSDLPKQSEDISPSKNWVINNIKQKIKKAKLLQDSRVLQLKEFLNCSYPEVNECEMNDGLDKDIFDLRREVAKKCLLADFVEVLLNASIMKPNDPWIEISGMWPPYVELLLRNGIAERNPENHYFVRLVKFD